MANLMPVYSVKNPPVSSCSASTRSNGGWLVSATAEITKITSATIAGSQYQSPLKIDLKPSQPCWMTMPRVESVFACTSTPTMASPNAAS